MWLAGVLVRAAYGAVWLREHWQLICVVLVIMAPVFWIVGGLAKRRAT